MPLADMGLVRGFDARDAAARSDAGARLNHADADADERVVRCVAGFYTEDRHAALVREALGAHFGLQPAQITVIHPSGLTREGLERLAQRWQCLRPGRGTAGPLWRALRGAGAGLVTGGLAVAIAALAAQAVGAAVPVASWLAPGLWAGAIAGAATSALLGRRARRHRFDIAVARQLQRGFSVVVAHGLGQRDEAPVLAYLQETSHSWAAEAPPCPRQR